MLKTLQKPKEKKEYGIESFEVVEVKNTGDYRYVTFTLQGKKSGYRTGQITYNDAPTCNCQVFNIAPINILLDAGYSREEYLQIFEKCKDLVVGNKNRNFIFDVTDNTFDTLEKVFGKALIEQPYESTNGSDMVLGMMRLVPDDDAIEYDDYDDEY